VNRGFAASWSWLMDIFFDLFLSKTRRRKNAPTRIGRRVLCAFFCEVDAVRERREMTFHWRVYYD